MNDDIAQAIERECARLGILRSPAIDGVRELKSRFPILPLDYEVYLARSGGGTALGRGEERIFLGFSMPVVSPGGRNRECGPRPVDALLSEPGFPIYLPEEFLVVGDDAGGDVYVLDVTTGRVSLLDIHAEETDIDAVDAQDEWLRAQGLDTSLWEDMRIAYEYRSRHGLEPALPSLYFCAESWLEFMRGVYVRKDA